MKIRMPILEYDKVVELKLPATYLTRLQQLAGNYMMTKSQEEIEAAIKKTQSKEPATNEFEYNVETIFALIFEIENQAKQQNLYTDKDVDIDTKDLSEEAVNILKTKAHVIES
jgi:hypothetical protein